MVPSVACAWLWRASATAVRYARLPRHIGHEDSRSRPVDRPVLFNPWIEKSRNLVDMNDDGYLNMVAVEPGTVSELATLQPGGCWSGTETVELLS